LRRIGRLHFADLDRDRLDILCGEAVLTAQIDHAVGDDAMRAIADRIELDVEPDLQNGPVLAEPGGTRAVDLAVRRDRLQQPGRMLDGIGR